MYRINLKEGPIFGDSRGHKVFAFGMPEAEARKMLDALKKREPGFDDQTTKTAYELARKRGYETKEVDQSELYRIFGKDNDPVAGRIGGTIYVGRNRGARKLTPVEMRSGLYHEMSHDDTDSETGAHRNGIELARQLGDSEAVDAMLAQLTNLERHNYN